MVLSRVIRPLRCRCCHARPRRFFNSSTGAGLATSVSRMQRPGAGGSDADVLLVGVGAAPQRVQFEAHITALLRDAAPSHVVLEMPAEAGGRPVQPDSSLLLRGVDQIIEQVVRQATFGLGSVPEGAGMDSYRALFWALGLTPQEEIAAVQQVALRIGLPPVQADAATDRVMATLRDALSFSELQNMLKAAASPQGQELQRLNQTLAAMLPRHAVREDAENFGAFLEAARPLQARRTVTALVDALSQIAPAVTRIVIDARAEMIASKLLALDGSTVAVVGLAQMDKIEAHFQEAGGLVNKDGEG